MSANLKRIILTIVFAVVPLAASVVSIIHVYKLILIGNSVPLAITISILIEITALSTLATVVFRVKVPNFWLWVLLILVFVIQSAGNVYYSFYFIMNNLNVSEMYGGILFDALNLIRKAFVGADPLTGEYVQPGRDIMSLFMACFMGLPIPVISLILTHYLVLVNRPGAFLVDEELEETVEEEDVEEEIGENEIEEKNGENKTGEEEAVTAVFPDVSMESEEIEEVIENDDEEVMSHSIVKPEFAFFPSVSLINTKLPDRYFNGISVTLNTQNEVDDNSFETV